MHGLNESKSLLNGPSSVPYAQKQPLVLLTFCKQHGTASYVCSAVLFILSLQLYLPEKALLYPIFAPNLRCMALLQKGCSRTVTCFVPSQRFTCIGSFSFQTPALQVFNAHMSRLARNRYCCSVFLRYQYMSESHI